MSGSKYKIGDHVEKISGSSWRGRVVGTYSTGLTPEGYAVESDTEKGSVQIYPAKALRPSIPSQRLDAATVERLRELAEAADDAWQGLKQTQLAASEVGVEIAQSVREGYGLHLTLALRDLAAALATEPHQHGGKGA